MIFLLEQSDHKVKLDLIFYFDWIFMTEEIFTASGPTTIRDQTFISHPDSGDTDNVNVCLNEEQYYFDSWR